MTRFFIACKEAVIRANTMLIPTDRLDENIKA